MAIQVERITSEAGLKGLSDEWRRLLVASRQDNLFLTWEWLSTWWRYFGSGQDLFLLCIRDAGGSLMGLAPFRIVHQKVRGGPALRVIQFLGSGSPVWSDDLDLIAKEGKEQEVIEAIGHYLLSEDESWDVLWLTDLGEDSLSADLLSHLFHMASLKCSTHDWAVCPYLPLNDPWAVYEEKAIRKFRDLKKYLKVLEGAGAEFGLVKSSEMLEKALEALVQLNQRRIESKNDIPCLSNSTFCMFVKEFCRIAFQRSWLRFYYIAIHDELIAVNLNFAYGQRAYGYLSGFNPAWQRHGVGTCLFRQAIRDSWEGGLKIYDFLRGDETYKYRWTSLERKTRSLHVVNHRGRYAVFRATDYVERVIRKVWRRTRGFIQGVP